MIEIMVWLLIAQSDGVYNRGNVSVVERFASEVQCEHVRKNIPGSGNNFDAKCVQARVLVPKGGAQ